MNTVLGLVSGALSTASLLPQVIRAIRTGSTTDLSWWWLALFVAAVGGWLVYGLLNADLAVAVTNAAMAAMISTLIVVKARHSLAYQSQ
ncbi:SemiSWEET family sugar transporter [Nocardia anaemiae]|uniref:SemiSWEET family sugar transporter n=1 Tax=Nocardia anaemiae TaxID=263910 RepID=UPI0007C7D942|nr:PQ-loop domain-containing transporter [Nocardia anaemiae]